MGSAVVSRPTLPPDRASAAEEIWWGEEPALTGRVGRGAATKSR